MHTVIQMVVVFNEAKQGSPSIYRVNSHEVESVWNVGMFIEVLGSASKCTEVGGTVTACFSIGGFQHTRTDRINNGRFKVDALHDHPNTCELGHLGLSVSKLPVARSISSRGLTVID